MTQQPTLKQALRLSSMWTTRGALLGSCHWPSPLPIGLQLKHLEFNCACLNLFLVVPVFLSSAGFCHDWPSAPIYFVLDPCSHYRFLSFSASIFSLSWAHQSIAIDLRPHLHCSHRSVSQPEKSDQEFPEPRCMIAATLSSHVNRDDTDWGWSSLPFQGTSSSSFSSFLQPMFLYHPHIQSSPSRFSKSKCQMKNGTSPFGKLLLE